MNTIKKILLILLTFIFISEIFIPSAVYANTNKIDEIISNMSNEDKIAMMIMPSFRKEGNVEINNDNIKDIISTYNFAGVILFAENTQNIESTMRFVDMLQDANKNHSSRLLIAIDQEGGYITRLGIGTNGIGNMALAATGNLNYAYDTGKTIGEELKLLGINTNFAPVVDINSNPANPVIGVRSFSDDPNIVAAYSEKIMQGLHDAGIITSLKHFPGHGDTDKDTHTELSVVNKTYDELKNNELIPFKKLIDGGTDMIMTAHIQFPKIETKKYISLKDNKEYTLPATLSEEILSKILREDLGYEGIIITDAFDMDTIAKNFEKVDASIKAINAGADILLMPYTYDSQINEFKSYISTLASKIGIQNGISENKVNAAVRRILKLKDEKGLLEDYDNTNLEEKIALAKTKVSSKENHDKEFDIAKKAITMLKNDDYVLPLNSDDKTVVLYEYDSHIKSVSNAMEILKNEGSITSSDNISIYPFYTNNFLPLDEIKEQVKDAKNVIMIHSLYSHAGLYDTDLNKMNDLIEYIHNNNGKVILMSTQLPYDVAKFINPDAIILTYLANGIRINLKDYNSEIPKYGPNVIAGIYMLYTKVENYNGVLPVNLYKIDNNTNYTDEILYSRGYGIKYYGPADISELENQKQNAKNIIDSKNNYTSKSLNNLNSVYNKVLKFLSDNKKLKEDKQNEINDLVNELKNAINNLRFDYKIIEGNNQVFKNSKDLIIKSNGDINNFIRLEIDGNVLDSSNYILKGESKIIILKKEYLNTLKNGKYTLTLVYNNGVSNAIFTINNKIKNPNTGDMILTYILLFIISIIGLLSTELIKKRFN